LPVVEKTGATEQWRLHAPQCVHASKEIALLVTDSDVAVALKCRSHLTRQEVEQHVERMNKFKRLLPRYADMQVHGAVAGMVVDEEAIEAA